VLNKFFTLDDNETSLPKTTAEQPAEIPATKYPSVGFSGGTMSVTFAAFFVSIPI
jgi:hypothetical protein